MLVGIGGLVVVRSGGAKSGASGSESPTLRSHLVPFFSHPKSVPLRSIDGPTCLRLLFDVCVVWTIVASITCTVDHGRFTASPCGDPNRAYGLG